MLLTGSGMLKTMRAGQASRTAVMVCTGRAIAHARDADPRFSDPTALALLPDDARREVVRHLEAAAPRGMRARLVGAFMEHQSRLTVARTIAIDDAVREASSAQLVILGAGLDGRAWRMSELADATVFEVDHPDSQRAKRERIGILRQSAREVRFVPVDFARDALDGALASAGHDPQRPTTWLWEGVVMYLTAAQIESTLDAVVRRSAPGSRVVVLYHAPSLLLPLVGLLTRRMGEPLRSTHTEDQMRALLSRHGFDTVRDEDLAGIGARLSPTLGRELRSMRHMRVVVADRGSRVRPR